MYSQYSNAQYYNFNNSKLVKPDPKIQQLQSDNKQLSLALQQLNQCYTEKVKILQEELTAQKQRTEQLLEERRQYIDKCLFCNQKYEEEIARLISTMEQINLKYQQEKQQMQKKLNDKMTQFQEQQQEVGHLRDQNEYLRNQRDAQQQRIQELVKTYIDQIQKLKNQLRDLKQQDANNIIDIEVYQESQSQQLQQEKEQVLKQISLAQSNASNLPCQVSQTAKNMKQTSISMQKSKKTYSQDSQNKHLVH